jgi:hypothetical protein
LRGVGFIERSFVAGNWRGVISGETLVFSEMDVERIASELRRIEAERSGSHV